MVLWIILFLIIIGLSFILAYGSMKDYQEVAQQSNIEYGLYLIRQTDNLNFAILDSLHNQLATGQIISLERLFKGTKSALTIFAPKKDLLAYTSQLNLLELEDYSQNLKVEDISIWEVGIKSNQQFNPDSLINFFKDLPQLAFDDQFFWQMVIGFQKEHNVLLQTQIKAVLYSQDPTRRQGLTAVLANLSKDGLIKVPSPYSKDQLLDFYRARSLSKDSKGPMLKSVEIVNHFKIS